MKLKIWKKNEHTHPVQTHVKHIMFLWVLVAYSENCDAIESSQILFSELISTFNEGKCLEIHLRGFMVLYTQEENDGGKLKKTEI